MRLPATLLNGLVEVPLPGSVRHGKPDPGSMLFYPWLKRVHGVSGTGAVTRWYLPIMKMAPKLQERLTKLILPELGPNVKQPF